MRCAGTQTPKGIELNRFLMKNGWVTSMRWRVNRVRRCARGGTLSHAVRLRPRRRVLLRCRGCYSTIQPPRRGVVGPRARAGDTDERFCGSFKLFRPDGSFMPHEQCPMAEVVSGKLAHVRDAEVLIERPDGSRITVVVDIRRIMSAQGEVAGAINCFFDITERKRIEEQSREYVAELADADRRKSEFMAMLAHEFRNPLATIHAGLQVQRLSAGDAQAAHSVTTLMERQVGHLVRLVDDLLDVNRISRGTSLRRGPVELATVVDAAVETARSLIERMGQRTDPRDAARADLAERRLLAPDPGGGNLLNNASKFTENRGRIVLASPSSAKKPKSGCAITEQALAPISFRSSSTCSCRPPAMGRSGTGLGIGLALVKSLVEMHDGTVEAHSVGVGHGSEFVVRLPITHEAARPQPITSPHEPFATVTARRVLVVDDNRDAAESLAMFLKLSGHDTYIAHDGLEAVDKAAQLNPDIILLDIGLPKINGLEAARRIRKQSQGNRPVLVALTGWGQDADRQKSREAGFDAHIVKPVDPVVLANLMVELPAVGPIR